MGQFEISSKASAPGLAHESEVKSFMACFSMPVEDRVNTGVCGRLRFPIEFRLFNGLKNTVAAAL